MVESKRRGAGSVGPWGVRSASMVVSGVTWGHFWAVLGCCGSILKLFWSYFGVILGSFLKQYGIILGLFWDHFGVVLESFFCHSWVFFRSSWDHFEFILELFWSHSGVVLESF